MQHDVSSGQRAAKLFFVVFVVVIAIDTLPLGLSSDSAPFAWIYNLKSMIRPVLRPIGLWQSEWRLFAPDPVISNCWWTIEVQAKLPPDTAIDSPIEQPMPLGPSNPLTWNSPFWGDVKPTEKFFKRRHIAYLRRMSEFPIEVLEDFADEWVRTKYGNHLHPIGSLRLENSPLDNSPQATSTNSEPYVLELSLFRNELRIAPSEDGTLPTREDTMWLSVTEKYLQRRYGE
jgi:hypothetical protein